MGSSPPHPRNRAGGRRHRPLTHAGPWVRHHRANPLDEARLLAGEHDRSLGADLALERTWLATHPENQSWVSSRQGTTYRNSITLLQRLLLLLEPVSFKFQRQAILGDSPHTILRSLCLNFHLGIWPARNRYRHHLSATLLDGRVGNGWARLLRCGRDRSGGGFLNAGYSFPKFNRRSFTTVELLWDRR